MDPSVPLSKTLPPSYDSSLRLKNNLEEKKNAILKKIENVSLEILKDGFCENFDLDEDCVMRFRIIHCKAFLLDVDHGPRYETQIYGPIYLESGSSSLKKYLWFTFPFLLSSDPEEQINVFTQQGLLEKKILRIVRSLFDEFYQNTEDPSKMFMYNSTM
ncbi:MAG: hypothetical protein R3E91_01840 [Chlamydiales bacterium]